MNQTAVAVVFHRLQRHVLHGLAPKHKCLIHSDFANPNSTAKNFAIIQSAMAFVIYRITRIYIYIYICIYDISDI